MSGPAGQRAIYAAGLFPIAACHPSTCALKIGGLEAARSKLEAASASPPLAPTSPSAIPVQSVSAPLARFDLPSKAQRLSDPTVGQIADSIFAIAGGERANRPLMVAARAGAPGAEASAARARLAAIRAEAVALSLRCAGLNVSRYGVDPSARFGGGLIGGAPGDAIRIEILNDTGR